MSYRFAFDTMGNYVTLEIMDPAYDVTVLTMTKEDFKELYFEADRFYKYLTKPDGKIQF